MGAQHAGRGDDIVEDDAEDAPSAHNVSMFSPIATKTPVGSIHRVTYTSLGGGDTPFIAFGDKRRFPLWPKVENSTEAVYVYYTYTNSVGCGIKRKSV